MGNTIKLNTDRYYGQIRKVAPAKAREDFKKLEDNSDNSMKQLFYETSGLKLIFRTLFNDGVIRDKIDGVFLEFSTLISTLSENNLDAFTLTWEKEGKKLNLKENVKNLFGVIINNLRKNNHAILNHPEFIINTTNITTFISINNDLTENDFFKKYNDIKKKQSKVIELNDILKKVKVQLSSSGISNTKFSYDKIIEKSLLDEYEKVCNSEEIPKLHELNHLIYDKYFLSEGIKRKTIFISIPLLGSKAKYTKDLDANKQPYEGLGVVFIYLVLKEEYSTNKENTDKEEDEKKESIAESLPILVKKLEEKCFEITTLTKDFLTGYAIHSNAIQLEKLLFQSKRSAIAVIMARNLSHTDGSHVMVDFENSVEKNFDYNQFKLYNQHLRNTMELVADVSGKIGIQSNYEYCLKEFFEDLKSNYFSKIVYNTGDDGMPTTQEANITGKFLGTGLNDGKAHSVLKTNLSVGKEVLFPGGENGKTAFISILKNIFRNFKKHSSSKSFKINEKTTKEEKVDYYKLDIKIENAEDELKDDYYKVCLIESSFSYDTTKLNEKIKEINKHLIEDIIIKNDGTVKNSGWGLLEMRICAAYLIGLPLDEFNYNNEDVLYKDVFRTYPMKFIYVDAIKIKGKHHLRHNFYLRKPKFATIWLNNLGDIKDESIKPLKEAGFIIKVKKEDKEGVIENRNYSSPSQFVVGNHKYETTAKHYNYRVISCNDCFQYNNDIKDLKIAISNKWIYEKYFSITNLIHIKNKEHTQWLENTDKKPIALIDDHCEYYKGVEDDKINHIKTTYDYYEKATTNNAYNLGLKNAPNFLKLETINTKICIWDERIKDFLEKNTDDDFGKPAIYKKDVFELKGITLPNENLHKYFYADSIKEDTEKNIKPYNATNLIDFKESLKKDFEKNDYVIVHFSGFENIIGRSKKEDGSTFTIQAAYDELLSHLKIGNYGDKQNPPSKYLIFTSGKGIPTTLPDSCYFIPYTTLKSLIEKKPKLDLVATLNSLRIINKKK